MAKTPLPSQDILNQLLRHDTETGKLYWRERSVFFFKGTKRSPEVSCLLWNAKNANCEALNYINPHGYKCGRILGRAASAHRTVWKMKYGFDPDVIDHIDGNRVDNRISNLRSIVRGDNQKNMKRSKVNKSGVTGVRKMTKSEKWTATINVDFSSIHLGCFDSFGDAVKARKEAEIKYGFHPNHGR